jgi:sterol desaturase/sphingolipid hydroxylase (fatty acid hydroxylase superfamily)
MDAYAQVLLIAIPFFIGLIIIEALYSYWKGAFSFNGMDTISSLSSGSTNTLKSVLKLSVIIISYGWLVDHIALFDIKATWLVWVLSFVAIDFASYWSHRLNHSINIFWNRHIVHHSSEEFNLACALRQPISNILSLGFIFLFPAALLGLPAKVIAVLAPIHLFLQFWYHTKHIPKLGWLEYILVTPSQHRVHHAINDTYLDKNLAAIFCVWDRWFGTFQEELEEEPCVYGVKRAVSTWNPIKINWQHMWQLTKDAYHASSWKDKFRIWFMPLGWRPKDVAEKYPIDYTIDPSTQVKYNPNSSTTLKAWSWVQYLILTALLTHMLIDIAVIGFPMLFVYGGFLFLMIYSFSSLMDMEKGAVWLETLKSISGLIIIYQTGGWFNLENHIPGVLLGLTSYFILSIFVVGYFVQFEIKGRSTPEVTKSSIG